MEQGHLGLSLGTQGVSCGRTSRGALANPNACGFGFATSVKYRSEAVDALGRVGYLGVEIRGVQQWILGQDKCGSQGWSSLPG